MSYFRKALRALSVPLVVAALTTAADTDAGAVTILRADYEDGTTSSGTDIGLNECCPHSIGVTTSVSRTGNHAIRSRLRYGDPEVEVGGTRAESHTLGMEDTYFRSGGSAYYGFSVYIPSTWRNDRAEDIVFQWKPWPDACETDKAPSAFLTTRPSGVWRLRVNSDGGRCSTPGSTTSTSSDFADVRPGRWHDFVFRFKWSHGDDGITEVWHQTHENPGWRQVVAKTGPNTFNDDETTYGYLKWGIYKPAWNTGPTDVTDRTVAHDNVAIGTSFSAVDPSVAR
ncbi:polysaccharide lyase [Actinosynnema sp. NPDC050801]|uniref:polysaccharide lyase n=1 Tax=unclassified Actinosynnema TaxID=2637065 RepID=UPI00340FD596